MGDIRQEIEGLVKNEKKHLYSNSNLPARSLQADSDPLPKAPFYRAALFIELLFVPVT